MKDGTDCAHLLRAYVRAWPAWLGGYEDGKRYGFKFHTASQRSGNLTRMRGFPVVSQRREGEDYHEYRFRDAATYDRARLQVEAWATGVDVATLEAEESLRAVRREGFQMTLAGMVLCHLAATEEAP